MPSNLIDLTARQLRQAASIREKIDALQKQLESILGATVKRPRRRRLGEGQLAGS